MSNPDDQVYNQLHDKIINLRGIVMNQQTKAPEGSTEQSRLKSTYQLLSRATSELHEAKDENHRNHNGQVQAALKRVEQGRSTVADANLLREEIETLWEKMG